MSQGAPPSKLHAIVGSQARTLRLFLSHPATRTPVTVLYVSTFGGALHAAVTTYYYLAIGASDMDIGRLGFIMSVGSLLGAPLSGAALDKYGPWVPISVTAGACAWGCLWRGVAGSLGSLRAGAILLGVGVNMWTVIVGHLVKSFPERLRSEVLSGVGVQATVLQLLGKGAFPLVDYAMRRLFAGLEDDLLRYRFHMGFCTFFCFYGTFALFWDRKNLVQGEKGGDGIDGIVKYQQKHSDVEEELEGAFNGENVPNSSTSSPDDCCKEIELAPAIKINDDPIHPSSTSGGDSRASFTDKSWAESSSSSFLNEPEPSGKGSQHLITTVTLVFALLLQSISTTILVVLWPLLAHDRFGLTAHTFGIITFVSSVMSTGAVASFPIVERLDVVGGRVRCSAWGFGLGSLLCLLFCFCSFSDFRVEEDMTLVGSLGGDGEIGVRGDSGGRFLEQDDSAQRLHSQKQILFHALSAMALQSVLCFLEPSLKSTLSIAVHSRSRPSSQSRGSSLGGVIGMMQTLGSIGGMVGNLSGTWMYNVSKGMRTAKSEGWANAGQTVYRGGSLPFVVTAALMAVVSASLMALPALEEPSHTASANNKNSECRENEAACKPDVENARRGGNNDEVVELECMENAEEERQGSCCLALKETTYDLKLD